MQSVGQMHAHDSHQNMIEPSATSGQRIACKSHVYSTESVGQA